MPLGGRLAANCTLDVTICPSRLVSAGKQSRIFHRFSTASPKLHTRRSGGTFSANDCAQSRALRNAYRRFAAEGIRPGTVQGSRLETHSFLTRVSDRSSSASLSWFRTCCRSFSLCPDHAHVRRRAQRKKAWFLCQRASFRVEGSMPHPGQSGTQTCCPSDRLHATSVRRAHDPAPPNSQLHRARGHLHFPLMTPPPRQLRTRHVSARFTWHESFGWMRASLMQAAMAACMTGMAPSLSDFPSTDSRFASSPSFLPSAPPSPCSSHFQGSLCQARRQMADRKCPSSQSVQGEISTRAQVRAMV